MEPTAGPFDLGTKAVLTRKHLRQRLLKRPFEAATARPVPPPPPTRPPDCGALLSFLQRARSRPPPLVFTHWPGPSHWGGEMSLLLPALQAMDSLSWPAATTTHNTHTHHHKSSFKSQSFSYRDRKEGGILTFTLIGKPKWCRGPSPTNDDARYLAPVPEQNTKPHSSRGRRNNNSSPAQGSGSGTERKVTRTQRGKKRKRKSEQGTIQSNSQMGFWMHKCIFVIGQTTTNALEPKEKMWEMYN